MTDFDNSPLYEPPGMDEGRIPTEMEIPVTTNIKFRRPFQHGPVDDGINVGIPATGAALVGISSDLRIQAIGIAIVAAGSLRLVRENRRVSIENDQLREKIDSIRRR